MHVRVVVAPAGAGQTSQETMEIFCGSGQQILRWLAYAACLRLAQRRGQVMGSYVPQAVVKDGAVLDVDLVLAEVVEDGELLLVEFSSGPIAFTTRWEQRPKSPALSWGSAEEADAAEVSPTAWLEQWDLRAEGLAELTTTSEALPQQQPPQQQTQGKPHDASAVQQNPQRDAGQGQDQPGQELPQQQPAASQQHQQDSAGANSADLESVRSVMLQHAGALQMLFLLYATEPSSPIDTSTRMGLPQFKAMLQAAKVLSSSVPPERVDELYMTLQASPGALARKGQSQCSTNGMDFADFLVLLVHVSHYRFAGESFMTAASMTQLSTKLLSLLQDCICTHLFPELQRRLDKLRAASTPAAKMLLKKGRRLSEQVLERCQVRRVRTRGTLRVPYTYVLKHLERWGLLGREFSLQELAPVLIFAKQQETDPYRFVLHTQPLALDYDEFEQLLLGIATLQARVRKRAADATDEILGELLDTVYRKSGVLVTLSS